MSKFLSGIAAAALLAISASAANAGVIYSWHPFDAAIASGEVMVMDFDHPIASGYTMTWSGAGVYQGPLVAGIAAPPQGDNTKYLSIQTGGTATLTSPGIMESMSLYIGSLDEFNSITFKGINGFSQTFIGSGLTSPANGNQQAGSTNRRYYFDFDPSDLINQVIFSSSGNSFEFDNIAVNDPPNEVPEPLTLSLFAAGLAGMAGLRRRKAVTA